MTRDIGTYLLNAYRQLNTQVCRGNGAEDASPGQRPGYGAPSDIVRPEGAEGACAPSGRQTIARAGTQGVALG